MSAPCSPSITVTATANTKLDAYRLMSKSMSLSYMTMRVVQIFAMIAGAYFVLRGEMKTRRLHRAFCFMVNVFFRPVEKINAVLETYPKGIAGFKRYTELLDTEPDVADAPDAVDVGHPRGDIGFENVTFGYEAHKKVLQGIDLHLRAGETVAFVGPSGAGKTTLCSLLPRFYDLDEGRVTVDGIDIRHMTLGVAAPEYRHRPAGRIPVRRNHPREHRLWSNSSASDD